MCVSHWEIVQKLSLLTCSHTTSQQFASLCYCSLLSQLLFCYFLMCVTHLHLTASELQMRCVFLCFIWKPDPVFVNRESKQNACSKNNSGYEHVFVQYFARGFLPKTKPCQGGGINSESTLFFHYGELHPRTFPLF